MERYYDLAYQGSEKSIYPLTNALVAKIVRALRAGRPGKSQLSEIAQLKDEARKLAVTGQMDAPDDFWAATGVIDIKLLDYLYRHLSGKKNVFGDKVHDELVGEYKDAWKQYGSVRELNSITDHYAFLVAVIRKSKAHENLCKVLEKILASLKSMCKEAD
jgi:hypothetical protein